MGMLSRALSRKSVGFSGDLGWLVGQQARAKSGVSVTRDQAFKVSVFFAALRVLGKGVAQVPFKLHQEGIDPATGLPSIAPARGHYLYDMVACNPNSWMTSYEFRETLVIHAALGNAFVFTPRVGGRIDEMVILDPSAVSVEVADDLGPRYWLTSKRSGERREVPRNEVWHVKGPSWSGLMGLEIIDLAREALGLSIAAEESHARLHANGVRPSGIYSVEGKLSPDQHRQLVDWIKQEGTGSRAHGAMVLDRAAKFIPQTMSGLDAEHMALRKNQIEEVCRFLDVMPIMIGYSDKTATFASSEAFFLAHVVHTLAPWYARIEGSADLHLLTREERAKGYYFKFNVAGLLRGDMKSTAEYLTKLVFGGVMDRNEARAKLELNPRPGLSAPLTPINMTTNPNGGADDAATNDA